MLGQREVSEAGGVRGVEGALELFWGRGASEGESSLLSDPGKMTPEGKSSAGLPQLRMGQWGDEHSFH